jgi:hypothetical protein
MRTSSRGHCLPHAPSRFTRIRRPRARPRTSLPVAGRVSSGVQPVAPGPRRERPRESDTTRLHRRTSFTRPSVSGGRAADAATAAVANAATDGAATDGAALPWTGRLDAHRFIAHATASASVATELLYSCTWPDDRRLAPGFGAVDRPRRIPGLQRAIYTRNRLGCACPLSLLTSFLPSFLSPLALECRCARVDVFQVVHETPQPR